MMKMIKDGKERKEGVHTSLALYLEQYQQMSLYNVMISKRSGMSSVACGGSHIPSCVASVVVLSSLQELVV